MQKLVLAALFLIGICAVGCKKEEAPMAPTQMEQAVPAPEAPAATGTSGATDAAAPETK
ncbi:MAG: hypothetical protein LHV68_11780 [Elusimicrobia bacterium]|nr:hypothetical protein [Candidatus Liberimonas magnetica]